MPSLPELIKGCTDRDPHLMEQFYHRFAPEMWVICLRYAHNKMMAEDLMQEGFIRAFEAIGSYEGKGAFEGWLKRVFVTTALNHLKKYYRFDKLEDGIEVANNLVNTNAADVLNNIHSDHLLELLKKLPPGFRTVFNLYAIEGYSHKEISKLLGCTESNSRSQLNRARTALQRLVVEMEPHQELFEKKYK